MTIQLSALFQTNLVLWLSLPGKVPTVNPIFHKSGYSVLSLNFRVNLPLEVSYALSELNLPVKPQKQSCPDFLLSDKTQTYFIILECKEKSFGPIIVNSQSHSVPQALTLLTLNGSHIAQRLGKKKGSNYSYQLIYLVNSLGSISNEDLMQKTLGILGDELKNQGLSVAENSSVGIKVEPDGLYLCSSSNSNLTKIGIPPHTSGPIKVMEGHIQQNADLFYLIMLDPLTNNPSKDEVNAFNAKILNSFMFLITNKVANLAPNETKLRVGTEEILKDTFDDLWEIFDPESKNALKSKLQNSFQPIAKDLALPSKGYQLVSTKNYIEIGNISDRNKFLSYIASSKFRKKFGNSGFEAIQLKLPELD